MERRVLIFSTVYFPMVGGAEIAVREITDRLPDWRFDLICARTQPGLPAAERVGNVMVYRCGIGRPIDKYLLPIFGVWRALRISRARNVACIWSLLATYGGVAALAYTWVRPKTKMLLTLQEGDPLDFYLKRVGRFARLHRRIFERANTLQAISTFLARWGVSMGFAGEPEIIPNGANLAHFSQQLPAARRAAIRRGWGVKDDDVVLITTSRLSLKNGIDDIIRALTMLPPLVKAVIVGEGEDREKLQVLTEQKRLTDRVFFLGSKPHAELPALLKASDIFIRPSLSEGLGNSFLEAMAADLPIIGTPVGGIPDFLTDGETGVFCQPRHPQSIRDAVHRLMGDAGLRERVVRQGRALVAERYEWDGISRRMGALLARLAA